MIFAIIFYILDTTYPPGVAPNITMFEMDPLELTKDDLYKVYAAKWVAAFNMSGEIGPKMECYIKVILQRKQKKYT